MAIEGGIRPFQGRLEREGFSHGLVSLDHGLLESGPFRAVVAFALCCQLRAADDPATATQFDMIILATVG